MLALISLANSVYNLLQTCLQLLVYCVIIRPCRLLYNGLFRSSSKCTSTPSTSSSTSSSTSPSTSLSESPGRKSKESIKRIINKRGHKTKPTFAHRIHALVFAVVSALVAITSGVRSLLVHCCRLAKARLVRALLDSPPARCLRHVLTAMSHKMIDCNHLRPRFISLQRDLPQFAPFYIFPTSPVSGLYPTA